MFTRLLLFASLTVGCSVVLADEPLWTDAERAKRSGIVFIGKVTTIERIAPLNDHEDHYVASIKVDSIDKSANPIEDATVKIGFARPKDGDAGKRCPTHVELRVDQKARFYVRNRKAVDSDSMEPWLEMGSDVGHTSQLSPIFTHVMSAESEESAVANARKTGVQSATKDIANNNLRILYYGKPRSAGAFTDDQTGYPGQMVGGCVVSKAFVAEVDGYNQTMRDYFRSMNPSTDDAQ